MKATALGITRNEKRLELRFVKNKEFFDLMTKVIGKFHIFWDIYEDYQEKLLNQAKTIEELEDQILHFEDKHLSIEMFLGHKKAFLVIRSSQELQEQIIEEIYANAEWKKYVHTIPKF